MPQQQSIVQQNQVNSQSVSILKNVPSYIFSQEEI